MSIVALIFYLFSAVSILSGVMVITARNPVHSVLFLILAFLNVGGLFVLMGAEFLAMILIIVYVGAVAILFLFVVMMLDINFSEMRSTVRRHWVLSCAAGAFFMIELLIMLSSRWAGNTGKAPEGGSIKELARAAQAGDAHRLGEVLYTEYFLLFQIAGLVLLVAMIGAIVLTLRSRSGVRKQKISRQLDRHPATTLEIVKVETGKGI